MTLCYWCIYGTMIIKNNRCVGYTCDLGLQLDSDGVCTRFDESDDTEIIRGVDESKLNEFYRSFDDG